MRRALRWEFWPMPVFYVPIAMYILYLAIRYRGLACLSCNPGMRLSGLYGENKAQLLADLQRNLESVVPVFTVLDPEKDLANLKAQANAFMDDRGLQYPMVVKPDVGQRGQGVCVVRSELELVQYLETNSGKVLFQQYIDGEEFGVFYIRPPGSEQGFVYSITEKTFPTLIGDGTSTLLQLLMSNSRTHYMAEYLIELHQEKLQLVLDEGELFKAVEIGSHCRGSVFLEASDLTSKELTLAFDNISAAIEGYYFGRFDIRVPSKQDLRKGENIKVIEFNGVTSESTNCYDPQYSVMDAYRIVFRQWRWAFEIGAINIGLGSSKRSFRDLLNEVRLQRATN